MDLFFDSLFSSVYLINFVVYLIWSQILLFHFHDKTVHFLPEVL